MVSLKWCKKQSKGIKLIVPNQNVAKEYLKDAKRDFSLIDREEPKWNIIKSYYACYNGVYSLLMKCGIKCEIHECTIALMELFGIDRKFINGLIELKKERQGVQYYLQKSKKDFYEFTKSFLELCEVKFLDLNDLEINKIRRKIDEASN